MWSARKYSNHIGSAALFQLTKEPFLQLFTRPNTPEEDLRVFSNWLAAILMANQDGRTAYPLTTTEARSVMRRAGHQSLSSFAHRLAQEMESAAPGEKGKVWRERVGPVFKGAWPLDVELQTPTAGSKLVQLSLAAGLAFEEVATAILPFVRPEDARGHGGLFQISEASSELYGSAPEKRHCPGEC